MLFNVREDIPIKQDGRVHANDGKIPMLMREHSGKISEKSAVSSSAAAFATASAWYTSVRTGRC